MKFKHLFVLFVFAAVFYSCGLLFFREIECRDFQIKGEEYWFPLQVGDSVVFINSTTHVGKKYTVVDKQISHRTKYVSDTGCGCLDYSGMLLTSGTDSLWFSDELRYVEEDEGNYYEDIFFVINGVQSGFYETYKTHLASYTLNSITFADVEFFEYTAWKEGLCVKKLYRAKDLGIISFELVNGEIWINGNLTKTGKTTQDSFAYSENTCD